MFCIETSFIYLFFCNLFIFLQQHNTVLRIHYLQSLNLQKALQYLQTLLTVTYLQYTLHYLQYITYNSLITVHVTKKLNKIGLDAEHNLKTAVFFSLTGA